MPPRRRNKRFKKSYKDVVLTKNVLRRNFRDYRYMGQKSQFARGNIMTAIPMGLPDSMHTKLKYNQQFLHAIAATPAQASVANFRMNGAYDPKASAGGNFPYWFSEYARMYDKYTVFASKIKVYYIATGDTIEKQTLDIGIVPFLENTTISSDLQVLNEMPFAKHKFTQLNTAAITPVLTSFQKCSKLFGVSKTKINDDDAYSALTNPGIASSGVPRSECFWAVYAGYPAGSAASNTTSIIIDVTITYYIRFWQKAEVSNPGQPSPDGPTGTTGPTN